MINPEQPASTGIFPLSSIPSPKEYRPDALAQRVLAKPWQSHAILFSLLLFCLPSTIPPDWGAPQKTARLQIKWPMGRKIIQRCSVKTIQKVTISGRAKAFVQKMEQLHDFSLEVIHRTPKGEIVIEMEILALKFGMQVGGQTNVFDSTQNSTHDAGNPYARNLRRMIGKKIRYTLLPDGTISKITGLDALHTQGSTNAIFDSELLKNMMTLTMTNGLVGKEVSLGQEWKNSISSPLPGVGTMKIETGYKFKQWAPLMQRSCAMVNYVGKIKMQTGKTIQHLLLTQGGGTRKGTIWFSPELGFPLQQQSVQILTLKMQSPPQAKSGKTVQNITSRLEQRMAVKVLRIEQTAGKE